MTAPKGFLDLAPEIRFLIYEEIFLEAGLPYKFLGSGNTDKPPGPGPSGCQHGLYIPRISNRQLLSRDIMAHTIRFAQVARPPSTFRLVGPSAHAVWKSLIALAGTSKQIQSEACYAFWRRFTLLIYASRWMSRDVRIPLMMRSFEPVKNLLDRLSLGKPSDGTPASSGLLHGLRKVTIIPTQLEASDFITTGLMKTQNVIDAQMEWKCVWAQLGALQTTLNSAKSSDLPKTTVHLNVGIALTHAGRLDGDQYRWWLYNAWTLRLPFPDQTARFEDIEAAMSRNWVLWLQKIFYSPEKLYDKQDLRQLLQLFEVTLVAWLQLMKSYMQEITEGSATAKKRKISSTSSAVLIDGASPSAE